ncbi:type IV pilus biogenesis protein PilM [Salibacterium salarium]|uniref:type IV pilus biogenesis protein PilM n=1 Tax=Salibacterium salarium TaxID=284579 RepID=UPI00163A9526|nr:pilus assembly protein PilM [Salibacterium salarium]
MELFGRKKGSRNTLIIKDHVIRFIQADEASLESIQRMEERYLPKDVIREGRIEDYETLEQILAECVEQWNLRNQPVQYCIPDVFVVARKVLLPDDIEKKEVAAYLYMEIGDSIPVPFEDPVFDFVYAPEGHAVILLTAPRYHVEAYASLLQRVRCKPNAADISALCFYRTLALSEAVSAKEHTLLLQVDLQAAMVSIYQKDKPLFVSHISLESGEELWEIKVGRMEEYHPVWMGADANLQQQMDTAADETERIMSFYRYSLQQGAHEIQKIIVGGDHPFLTMWVDTLAERVDIPVKQAEAIRFSTFEEEIPVRFFENAGLVLKENIRN